MTLDLVIVVQLLALMAILITKEMSGRRHSKAVVGNPHMPHGSKTGDVEAHYWISRFDMIEAKQDKIVDATTQCVSEMRSIHMLIDERLPRP